jgi:hypothetical protein
VIFLNGTTININVYTDRIYLCEINCSGTGFGQLRDPVNASMNLLFHSSGQHPGYLKILSGTDLKYEMIET